MHKVVTLREQLDLAEEVQRLHRGAWPVFLGHDAAVNRRWPALYTVFPEYRGIDRERDRGRYEDPNVWMRHPVPAAGV